MSGYLAKHWAFFEGFGGFETALRVGISAAMPMNTVIPFSLIVPREGGLKFIEIEGDGALVR
jgi:hypothetical protein